MIQVALRIAVWVAVFGIGYLLFGPQLFDSSQGDNPFENKTTLYLPAAQSARESALQALAEQRALSSDEQAEYQALLRDRQARFWQREGTSVEEALSGVTQQRKQRLVELLQERGLAPQEAAVFLMVVERDHPALLADR